jgi:hypothetical protein
LCPAGISNLSIFSQNNKEEKMKHSILKFTLAFLFLTGTVQVLASEIQVRVPELTGTVGQTIDVPIYIDSSLTGHNVYSYQFLLNFTAYRLQAVEIFVAGTMSESWGMPAYSLYDNKISVANAGGMPLTGSGVVFIIRFNILANGFGFINFDGGSQNNYFNEGEPPMIFDDGYVYISNPPTININPDHGLIIEGEQLQFTAYGGTTPYTWSLTNPAVANINMDGLLTGLDQGFTKVKVVDAAGIVGITDQSIEIRVAGIYLEDTSGYQGTVVDVPVYLTNVDGEGISSISFSIDYSANILEAMGFSTTGTLLEPYGDPAFNSYNGGVNVAFANETPLAGEGVLMYITFQVTSVSTYGTNYSTNDILFNEALPGKGNTAFFDVLPLPDLNITPNTGEVVAGETMQFAANEATAPIAWTTTNPLVASINASGLLTAHKSGEIRVMATDALGATGTSGNIQVYDTYVSIANGLAPFGSIYDLPVTMSDLPAGQEVFAMQGAITFEEPELDFIDIITAGSLSEGWSISQTPSGNTVNFALAGTQSFNTSGILFFLRFQLTGDLSVGEHAFVDFGHLIMNEGIPLPKLVDGGITASDLLPGTHTQTIPVGWNGISSYIIPSNPDVTAIFAPLGANLEMLYNMDGEMYAPSYGINTIGNWDQQQGYIIKNVTSDDVVFDGFYNANRTINVVPGWNLIPVISTCPVDPALLDAGISGLQMIKQVAGTGVFWPAFGINTLGNLQPGYAYFLYSTSYGSFTYPTCPKADKPKLID